jgi:hypothetical protein
LKIGARFSFYKEQRANVTLSAFFNDFPLAKAWMLTVSFPLARWQLRERSELRK